MHKDLQPIDPLAAYKMLKKAYEMLETDTERSLFCNLLANVCDWYDQESEIRYKSHPKRFQDQYDRFTPRIRDVKFEAIQGAGKSEAEKLMDDAIRGLHRWGYYEYYQNMGLYQPPITKETEKEIMKNGN